jgi:hypothetical protein
VALAVTASLWVGVASAAALEANVLNAPYNAKGNGTTNDRAAIQSAINAVAEAGGGKVILPKAHIYLTGDLVLKSKVTFDLETGAVLKQSQTPGDYLHEPKKGRTIEGRTIEGRPIKFDTFLDQNFPLLYAGKATEVTINGGGEIEMTNSGADEKSVLLDSIGMFEVTHFVISNVTISNSSGYNVALRDSEFGEVKNVTTTKPASINSDGISMMDSSHLEVFKNNLTTLDDGIYVWASLKDPRKSEWWNSDTPRPSTDINVFENVVNNESTNGSHGFLFINWTGAEEDASQVEIARLNVHNNTFKATFPLGALVGDPYHPGPKTPTKDLTFQNNKLEIVGSGEIPEEELKEMGTTDLNADSSVYAFDQASNKTGILNNDFDGHNAFPAEKATSFWSTEGKASAPETAVGQPSGKYGQITGFNEGYSGIYQGVFLEPGTYTFRAATQSSGAAVRFFAIRASNLEVMASTSITNTKWETKSIKFTVTTAGNYRLGIDDQGAGGAAGSFGRIDNTELE